MSDLIASGQDPGTQYQPSETDGVYHEDREVTVAGGPGSQMFRVYGAKYDSTLDTWTLQSGVSVAYATVQNPDGSIHYFTQSDPSGWGPLDWQGSSNNTVYNAVDFGAPPLSASGSASDNTLALGSLLSALNAPATGNQGGYAWIPQFQFPVNASDAGLPVPPGVIMQGLGTGGQSGAAYYHFSISDPGESGPYTFFSLDAVHTSGGTYFRNIAFEWNSAAYALDTVLYLHYFNGGADSCTFSGCATAAYIQGLGIGFRNCTINYSEGNIPVPFNFTAILLSGINCEISGPSEFNGKNLEGATTACISIGGKDNPTNCNLNKVRSLHITGWNYGIDYSDINGSGISSNTADNVIEDCVVDSINTCVNLQPASSSGQIFNQEFSNNTFTKSQDSTTAGPIVFIDSNSGTATNIDQISLIDNTIYSNVTGGSGQGGMDEHTGSALTNQYGVQIGTCAAVSIVGGRISQCGTKTGAGTDGTANICISGNPTSVTVTAVNLSGLYPGANSGGSTGSDGSAASEYALLISGDPQLVEATDCLMSGTIGYSVSITGNPGTVRLTNCTFGSSALSVTGTPTSLIVRNSTGYNDQNTTINTLAHITDGMAYSAATQGSNSGTSYYGPSLVTFTANSSAGGTFQVNGGTPQGLLANQFVTVFLNSPYDTIQFNVHPPAAFAWTGR
jgi:hypothetical protein